MTFTEAAEVVLRKVGKPLHYKKITQLAIEQNLLSHVGKTPETTMSTRLATLTKKDRGEAAIVRVKPGVFGLRDWGATAADLAEEEAETEEPTEAAESESTEGAAEEEAEEVVPSSPEEQERAQRLVAGAQLFPEEADDNDPVMAEKPVVETPAATAAAGAQGEGGRRRRRRRRRGRGGERGEAGAEGAAGETEGGLEDDTEEDREFAASAEPMADDAEALSRAEGLASSGEPSDLPREGEGESLAMPGEGTASMGTDVTPRADFRREGRRDERRDEGRERRDEGRERRDEGRERRDEGREVGFREETGRDAADLLVSLLNRREDRQPIPLRVLVDDAVRSGKVTGDASALVPTLSAAARADGARREQRGERPRLRIANGRVGLVDWALGPDLVRAEADALASLERLRDAARRQLIRRLNELPQPAFTELVVLLLERMGISSLRATRRPGLPQGEIHLAGVARRANEELRVAVLIKRGGEVGRERVIELRGSLHHYGPATSAWVVTTGNVLSGARDEAAQPGTAPVAVIDGNGLGRLFDEYAVGVRHATVNIPYVDLDLIDALRQG